MPPSILGLAARDEACPVCELKPQHFLATVKEGVVECHRCGFYSQVVGDGAGGEIPVPATHAGWIEVFQRYYRETGGKLSHRDVAGDDPILVGRCEALEKWLEDNQGLVARAQLATVAPYVSVTGILVELEGGEKRWELIVPETGAGRGVGFPIDPSLFAIGTIITIQQPFVPEAAPPEGPRLVVVGNGGL